MPLEPDMERLPIITTNAYLLQPTVEIIRPRLILIFNFEFNAVGEQGADTSDRGGDGR